MAVHDLPKVEAPVRFRYPAHRAKAKRGADKKSGNGGVVAGGGKKKKMER